MFGYGSCWGKGMNTANEVPHRECQFVCVWGVCLCAIYTSFVSLCPQTFTSSLNVIANKITFTSLLCWLLQSEFPVSLFIRAIIGQACLASTSSSGNADRGLLSWLKLYSVILFPNLIMHKMTFPCSSRVWGLNLHLHLHLPGLNQHQ